MDKKTYFRKIKLISYLENWHSIKCSYKIYKSLLGCSFDATIYEIPQLFSRYFTLYPNLILFEITLIQGRRKETFPFCCWWRKCQLPSSEFQCGYWGYSRGAREVRIVYEVWSATDNEKLWSAQHTYSVRQLCWRCTLQVKN